MTLAFLIGLLLCGSYAQLGKEQTEEMNRVVWVAIYACLIVAWSLPNPWLGVLLALVAVNLRQLPAPRNHLEPHIYPALLWAGCFLAVSLDRAAWTIPVLLGGILAVGSIASLWFIQSFVVKDRPYQRTYTLFGKSVILWEHPHYWIAASQGNPNHLHAVLGTSLAAGIGLLLLNIWSALPFVVLVCVPIGITLVKGDGSSPPHPPILWGYLAALVLCLGPLAFGWIGLGMSLVLGGIFTGWAWVKRPAWWALRPQLWAWGWTVHRGRPVYQQFIGSGTGSWLLFVDKYRPFPNPPTNAHNEFLSMLIDHGWLGVLTLMGYLCTAFWKASQAGAPGQAVFLVGSVLVLCAAVSFPWHGYIEVGSYKEQTRSVELSGHGATSLNVMSFATAIMVEAL